MSVYSCLNSSGELVGPPDSLCFRLSFARWRIDLEGVRLLPSLLDLRLDGHQLISLFRRHDWQAHPIMQGVEVHADVKSASIETSVMKNVNILRLIYYIAKKNAYNIHFSSDHLQTHTERAKDSHHVCVYTQPMLGGPGVLSE